MGKGDDTVTYTSFGTGGSADGGDGTDTLIMTNTVAAANDGDGTFNTKATSFETVRLSDALSGTINMFNLNNPATIVLDAGGDHLPTAILDNVQDGATVEVKTTATGVSTQVSGAGSSTSNTLTYKLSNSTGGAEGFASLRAANIETVNITMNDTGTALNTATIDTATLVATSGTSLSVSGNNGLTLTNTDTTWTSATFGILAGRCRRYSQPILQVPGQQVRWLELPQ